MGLSRTIIAAGVLVLALGCNVEEPDRVVAVSAHGSETNSGSTGGATIVGVSRQLSVEHGAWIFGEPEAFAGRIRPVSLVAVGDAMFRAGPEAEVVDALRTDRGTVALVREPGGKLLLLHYEEERSAGARAPAGARRVLAGTDDPFSVRILVADDLVVAATRTE